MGELLQPFDVFRVDYLDREITCNRIFLVSQTYTRYKGSKIGILVTSYSDRELAYEHLQGIVTDRYAALIDLRRPEHRGSIKLMLRPQSKYVVYWMRWPAKNVYESDLANKNQLKLWRFYEHHARIKIAREGWVKMKLEIEYGELMATLYYADYRPLKARYQEIEEC